MKMTKEQLKEFWERDKEYREEAMMEKLEDLTRQVDMLKQDVEKWNKQMTDGRLSKGEAFNHIIAEVKNYSQRFDAERMMTIQSQWEKSNAILSNIELLEKAETNEK